MCIRDRVIGNYKIIVQPKNILDSSKANISVLQIAAPDHTVELHSEANLQVNQQFVKVVQSLVRLTSKYCRSNKNL